MLKFQRSRKIGDWARLFWLGLVLNVTSLLLFRRRIDLGLCQFVRREKKAIFADAEVEDAAAGPRQEDQARKEKPGQLPQTQTCHYFVEEKQS